MAHCPDVCYAVTSAFIQFACCFLLGKGLKEKNHSALTRKTISGVREKCLREAGVGGIELLQTEMFQG